MIRLVALFVLTGCASGSSTETALPAFPSFPVTVATGPGDSPPVFSWPGGGVRELRVADVEDGFRDVWVVVAGEHPEHDPPREALISSPVRYGASTGRTVAGPEPLRPGRTYSVRVRRLPGSHSFAGEPAGPPRAGEASFTLARPVE